MLSLQYMAGYNSESAMTAKADKWRKLRRHLVLKAEFITALLFQMLRIIDILHVLNINNQNIKKNSKRVIEILGILIV